jgi:hypothetical protein
MNSSNDLHMSGQDVFDDLLTLVLIRLIPLHAVEHQVVLHAVEKNCLLIAFFTYFLIFSNECRPKRI